MVGDDVAMSATRLSVLTAHLLQLVAGRAVAPSPFRPRIFISYRRSDAGAIVGRIYDRLVARFKKEAVFRDLEDIPLALDFRDRIRDEMTGCDVVLVVIGPHWAGLADAGTARIHKDDDPVRMEVEAALAAGATTIPVLVEAAPMPARDDLPASLHGLPSLTGIRIDVGKDFDHHMAELGAAVEAILDKRGKFAVHFPQWALRAAIWCAFAAAVALAAFYDVPLLEPGTSSALALAEASGVSLVIALACGLVLGDAAAKRRVPGVLVRKHPTALAAAGGALAISLALPTIAPLLMRGSNDPIFIANRLFDTLKVARAQLTIGRQADFARAEELLAALRRIDPQSGHSLYFAGEMMRTRNTTHFTPKACFKGWTSVEVGSLDEYEQDFFRYRVAVMAHPAVVKGKDMRWQVCYQRADGICLQRLYWIDHLLANDYYLNALTQGGTQRIDQLKRAATFATEANKFEEDKRVGFSQCIPTAGLIQKIDEALAAPQRQLQNP
jgi:hypothetical protein